MSSPTLMIVENDRALQIVVNDLRWISRPKVAWNADQGEMAKAALAECVERATYALTLLEEAVPAAFPKTT